MVFPLLVRDSDKIWPNQAPSGEFSVGFGCLLAGFKHCNSPELRQFPFIDIVGGLICPEDTIFLPDGCD
ncbi:hypothetical protein P3S67_002429 [Capsicum chacoense]